MATNEQAPDWEAIDGAFDDDQMTDTKLIEMVINGEVAAGHTDSDTPHPEALRVLTGWNEAEAAEKTGLDWIALRRERWDLTNVVDLSDAWGREQKTNAPEEEVPANDGVDAGPLYLNHAILRGEDHPDLQAVLDRPARMMTGAVWSEAGKRPPKGKRNTQDGEWEVEERTLEGWIEDLACHPVSGSKYGPAIVFGEGVEGTRKNEAMKSVEGIGLDIDAGHTRQEVIARIEGLGLFAIEYTSHSHGRTESSVKLKTVQSKLSLTGEPTDDHLRTYLRDHAKDVYSEEYLASVKIVDPRKMTGDGTLVVYSHLPAEKFRVFVPFRERLMLSDLDPNPEKALKVWEDLVTGFARNMLGVHFDTSCTDASRLYFTPRHRKDAPYGATIIQGRPLSHDEIRPMSKALYTKNRKANAFEMAGGEYERDRPPMAFTPSGKSLNDWHRSFGQRFMAADLIEIYCEDRVRGKPAGGKVEIACPFEHEHSSEGGTACMAVNCVDSPHEWWTVSCRHDACQGRHKLEHLQEMLNAGWFDEGLLFGNDFMQPGEDDEEEEPEDLARRILRENLVGDRIEDGGEAQAVQALKQFGLDQPSAEEIVRSAKAEVLEQVAARAADAERDPVAEAEASLDASKFSPARVLAPLHDEALVDERGYLVKPEVRPEVYRRHKIDPAFDGAQAQMVTLLQEQMRDAMTGRFSYVVLDGEAKVAVPQGRGENFLLWKDSTLAKLYINRAVSYEVTGPKGRVKTHKIKPDEIFLYARQRQTFASTCFEPDPVKAADAARRDIFNLWTGFRAQPREGDWSKLRNHIRDNLCSGNKKHFNFVMTWLASTFARPGVKVPSSLVIIGEQGTGKSKVFDWVREAIGAAALKVSAGKHLTGNFNAHLDGKIFLTCEEAFWGGDKQAAGVMKDIVSSDTLQIEGKFEKLVTRPNYLNTVFISNNSWVVPVDGEDARRFFVLECSNARKKDAVFFGEIDDQMRRGGMEAMVHELMHWNPATVDLTWHDLRNPPVTEALRQQAGMGLEGAEERIVVAVEMGELGGRTADGDAFHYTLSETEPTRVAKVHAAAYMQPNNTRGNLAGEAKKAVTTFLGEGADSGDNKDVIRYRGEIKSGEDSRVDKTTEDRVRYITFPPLSEVRPKLAAYGRG
ncbi:hypothetical protein SAMN04488012_12020 [Palleronia salina]|uniref:NrS-1 polymerase-like helicase domain-containing protein n=1 Tax=Palleronia salina TaxID=313368 RepID=A0A1M6M5E6_9RHOB|nr:hypothetical protein SAMN04488012_12020 [Palleronia salina]